MVDARQVDDAAWATTGTILAIPETDAATTASVANGLAVPALPAIAVPGGHGRDPQEARRLPGRVLTVLPTSRPSMVPRAEGPARGHGPTTTMGRTPTGLATAGLAAGNAGPVVPVRGQEVEARQVPRPLPSRVPREVRPVVATTVARQGRAPVRARVVASTTVVPHVQDPRPAAAMTAAFVLEAVLVAAGVTIHTSPYEGHTEVLLAAALVVGGRKAAVRVGVGDDVVGPTEAPDGVGANVGVPVLLPGPTVRAAAQVLVDGHLATPRPGRGLATPVLHVTTVVVSRHVVVAVAIPLALAIPVRVVMVGRQAKEVRPTAIRVAPATVEVLRPSSLLDAVLPGPATTLLDLPVATTTTALGVPAARAKDQVGAPTRARVPRVAGRPRPVRLGTTVPRVASIPAAVGRAKAKATFTFAAHPRPA